MATLIKTIKKKIILYEEVELTLEQSNLYFENEVKFFEEYGDSLKWVRTDDSHQESEWINIFTKGETPY